MGEPRARASDGEQSKTPAGRLVGELSVNMQAFRRPLGRTKQFCASILPFERGLKLDQLRPSWKWVPRNWNNFSRCESSRLL
jgi:hypothetical protein